LVIFTEFSSNLTTKYSDFFANGLLREGKSPNLQSNIVYNFRSITFKLVGYIFESKIIMVEMLTDEILVI